METSATTLPAAVPAAPPTRKRRVRNYLLDARIQLRLAAYLLGVAVALSAALGWLLWTAYAETTRVLALGNPAVAESLAQEDRARMMWMVGALVLVLAALLAGAVVITHRIAGPAFAIARTCRQVARGTLAVPRPLRSGDLLVELAAEVAGMVDALRKREEREGSILRAAVASLRDGATGAEDRARAADALEKLAAEKARRLGP
jgi:methyl-accepting chemotaxis protein